MITIIYAGLLGLMYMGLAFMVVGGRINNKLSFGDGGNPDMIRRIRAHGNFAEYVPFALLLLFMVDYVQYSPLLVHLLGALLVLARILHATGIYKSILRLRVTGMILTMVIFVVTSILLLRHFITLQLVGF